MTEAEWFAEVDPKQLIDAVASKASPRQLRLFMAGWCRRAWGRYSLARVTRLVEAAERFADQAGDRRRLDEICREHRGQWVWGVPVEQLLEPRTGRLTEAVRGFCAAVGNAAPPFGYDLIQQAEWRRGEQRALASVFRDVLGSVFRPVVFDPDWRTSTAVALARQMYESREFSAMPILADALQDAGCEDEAILTHCRDAGQPHVRGCWVVDLVLGKS
jgi:hypothetical protein